MAVTLYRGPAGGGKSQRVEADRQPNDVVVDFTRLYVALAGVERDLATGKFPVRTGFDPILALAQRVKTYALREAVARGHNVRTTTSDSRQEAIDQVVDVARSADPDVLVETVTLDPGREIIVGRLSDEDGSMSLECLVAIDRWYRDGNDT